MKGQWTEEWPSWPIDTLWGISIDFKGLWWCSALEMERRMVRLGKVSSKFKCSVNVQHRKANLEAYSASIACPVPHDTDAGYRPHCIPDPCHHLPRGRRASIQAPSYGICRLWVQTTSKGREERHMWHTYSSWSQVWTTTLAFVCISDHFSWNLTLNHTPRMQVGPTKEPCKSDILPGT